MGARAPALAAAALLAAASGAAASPGTVTRTFRFVDRTRVAHFRSGAVAPRVLPTVVRYPSSGRGPFPLIIFAHGFALAPGTYARLLDAWARAGFVVAAPLFPVERPGAPGGPSESDLANEPGDIRFVTDRLLTGPLRALIDARRVGVAGQSDGGVAALTAAFGAARDRRIEAAAILSGAQPAGIAFDYGRARAALLAVQGTRDTTNAPVNTAAFFARAHRPKFLLWLIGAEHLPPYTTNSRYLGIVERATVAFFDRYLRDERLGPLLAVQAGGGARLEAEP